MLVLGVDIRIPNEDFSGGMPRAEFTGRWGFITPNSIPKPITRAFQLLAAAGSDLIVSSATSSNCTGASVVAVANSSAANSGVMVFVSNQGVASCDVTVNLGSWASESTQGQPRPCCSTRFRLSTRDTDCS